MNGDSKDMYIPIGGSVAMLKDFQHTAKDDSEAAIQALTAGVDLEASSNCYWALEQLIEQGRFDEKICGFGCWTYLTC